jgi:uncharacterized protein
MKITRKKFLKRTLASATGLIFLKSFSSVSGAYSKKKKVKYRILGRTGIKVSEVGMGASRTMEPSVIMAALDNGINFFDTGRSYANGQNEVMLGKVLSKNRDKVVIQSKAKVKNYGTNKEIIKQLEISLSESLKALQTDYIDVFLLHMASKAEYINNEEVIRFLEDAKKAGRIRATGFSSHDNFVELLKINNTHQHYDVVMTPFNYKGSYNHSESNYFSEWNQDDLLVELKKIKENNIGFVAMKTASAGPYSPNGGKESYMEALRWILQYDFVSSVVPAMGNINEINENVQAMW